MKKSIKLIICSVFVALAMTGCSHKISIDPSLDEIRDAKVKEKINVNVGYYISQDIENKKVVTPGGGGDKVDYTPYKDTETALNVVLLKIFNNVYKVKSLEDKKYIESKNIRYVFLPTIKTDSSSESLVTWPPTKFTIELKCKAINSDNKTIWEETIYAEGNAEFDEFKNNFALSAQRATEKVFKNMLIKLKETDKFSKDIKE